MFLHSEAGKSHSAPAVWWASRGQCRFRDPCVQRSCVFYRDLSAVDRYFVLNILAVSLPP